MLKKFRKSQALPMSTVIIIILVVLVLAAIGILFFTNFNLGVSGVNQANASIKQGISNLTDAASNM